MADTKVVIEEIRLQNFRCFKNARLRLADLTFLVGANGTGKSAVLEAVGLLRAAALGNLESELDRRGGIAMVTHVGDKSDENLPCGLAVRMSAYASGEKSAQAVWGFKEVPAGHGEGHMVQTCWKALPDSYCGYQTPVIAAKKVVRNMWPYQISAKEVTRSNVCRVGGEAKEVVRCLTAIAPSIVNVGIDPLGGGLRFTQQQDGGTRELSAAQGSQGTLRELGVLLALKQATPPSSLVLIDEIEQYVHPSGLAVLVDVALSTARHTQVVLTSHSPEVLSHPAVTGDRVRVCVWRGGQSHIYRLNEAVREAINEGDTVGQMLQSNTLRTEPVPDTFTDLFEVEGE